MHIELFDRNLLELDIEFGNASAFYSNTGHDNRAPIDPSNKNQCLKWSPKLEGTDVSIYENIAFGEQGELSRKIAFKFNNTSRIFDLVSRFIVWSNNDRAATIAEQDILHKSTNIYYQFPVDFVKVPAGDSSWINFSSLGISSYPGYNHVFYIRDEREENGRYKWIVHHRIIVDPNSARLIVRCCNPRMAGEVPCQFLIPKFIKKCLFRIRERAFPSFPFMTVGEIDIKPNTEIIIRTKIKYVK